jgi:acetoin utilization deacetylase AcuC-like enzyme
MMRSVLVTLLFTDPLFLTHHTGRHPENEERLHAITTRLSATGLLDRCSPGTYVPLTAEQIRAVHAPDVGARVQQLASAGGGYLDSDTVVSAASYHVGLAAAGACVAAVDAVVTGQATNALCLVRPPGHHATPTRSMGFCLFNNIALAARQAQQVHGLTRILIVDWDVHHGNGTQDVFYEDPEIVFYSIHRYGRGFYPGSGSREETGQGRGLGRTFNEPIRYGTSRAEYMDHFRLGLERAATFNPELVLVSAGFDAHRDDPIGSLGLETEDFAVLTRAVLEVARTHAGGRVVSCLEGGYNLEALAAGVQTHLEGLLSV